MQIILEATSFNNITLKHMKKKHFCILLQYIAREMYANITDFRIENFWKFFTENKNCIVHVTYVDK